MQNQAIVSGKPLDTASLELDNFRASNLSQGVNDAPKENSQQGAELRVLYHRSINRKICWRCERIASSQQWREKSGS